MKILYSLFLALAVVALAFPAEATDCYKKCVSEKSVCKKSVNQCMQQGLNCIRTENVCRSRDSRTGRCLSYDQRCAQYQQVCTRYQQVCVEFDRTCAQYQTVCPDSGPKPVAQGQRQGAPSGGKALDQLKQIEGERKDWIFDGGGGSTLNRTNP